MEEAELTAGLEIHQQLDTGKLFCRCPSRLKEGNPDYSVRRKIRLAASELGEFDKAAVEMFRRGYSFTYNAYKDVCCLVEIDEEPPHACNEEALKTALEVSLMGECTIPDKLFVMRKTVIDGSNVSGFQRTMLVSLGGKLKTKNGKEIGLQSLALEEDAARPVSKDENKAEIVYSLDRLGIPLIELATEPCFHTPEDVKDGALAIGEMMRRTGKAKRGLGTIRQDLNISIKGGARVEIKGVQELDKIDECVRREMQRQKSLLEIKEEIAKRGIAKDDLDSGNSELNDLLRETKCGFVKKGIEQKQKVLARKISKFKGLLGKEVQPGRRFGTELASYVKARAGLKGIIHSDENLSGYGFSEDEIKSAKEKLNCSGQDAFAIVVGAEEKCKSALDVIAGRCKEAFDRVPEETRNALEDANSEYSRPLPGAARMYPETDVRPIEVGKKTLEKMKKDLPLAIEARLELYTKKFGLSEKLAEEMKLSNYARFFERVVYEGADAKTLAVLLLEGLTEIRREGISTEDADEEFVRKVMDVYMKGIINKDVLLDFVRECLKSKEDVNEAAIKFKKDAISHKDVEKRIDGLIEKNKELVQEKGQMAFGALMGDLMKEYKGKVSGKVLGDLLRKKLG